MNAVTTTETLTLEDAKSGPIQLAPATPLAVQQSLTRGESFMLTLLDKGLDFDKIEKAMDLKDRMDRRDAEIAFNAAFSAFKAESVEIVKRKLVSFPSKGGRTEYTHAELADVLDAVTPNLSKHGLSISWRTKQERTWIEVTCTLKHSAGHEESVTLGAAPDDSGGKNSIQAVGSAITYLERYTAKAILGVAEKGQDDDGAGTTLPAADDKLLDQWREIAMQGSAALRQHYDANVPTEDFWKEHGPSLRAAAKKADQDGSAK